MECGDKETLSYDHLDYRFCQTFGDECDVKVIPNSERLSAISFDYSGDFFAVGNGGGGTVVFKRTSGPHEPVRGSNNALHPSVEYALHTEFSCKESSYDILRSIDVSLAINSVNFLPPRADCLSILTSNSRDVKLWSVRERHSSVVSNLNFVYDAHHHVVSANSSPVPPPLVPPVPLEPSPGVPDVVIEERITAATAASAPEDQGQTVAGAATNAGTSDATVSEADSMPSSFLSIPKVSYSGAHVTSDLRRIFSSVVTSHINALSVSPNSDLFLISDDFSVIQWWLEDHTHSFMLVDIRPNQLSDVVEVISTSCFHATSQSIFAYGTSKGCVRLCDTRARTISDRGTASFSKIDRSGSLVSSRATTAAPSQVATPPALESLLQEYDIFPGAAGTRVSCMEDRLIQNLPSVNIKSAISRAVNYKVYQSEIESIKFLGNNLIVARDLTDVCVYDIRAARQPLSIYPVNLAFSGELIKDLKGDPLIMYEKFDLALDRTGKYIATGTFNDMLNIYNTQGTGMTIQLSRHLAKRKKLHKKYPGYSVNAQPICCQNHYDLNRFVNPAKLSREKAVRHVAYHPTEDILAATTTTNVFLYGSVQDDSLCMQSLRSHCSDIGMLKK